MKHRYHTLNEMLQAKYGKKIRKICIDGGFTCPNRDGTCGYGGCVFCGERGAGEQLDPSLSIRQQTENGLKRGGSDAMWILYFQNFTNTYAPVAELKKRYDAALIDARIKILDIGTRPDCINDEIADLLASYQDKYEVWVELGLQTANDTTAKQINRGYDLECFRKAVSMLKAHNLPVIVHIILGLPNETLGDIRKTIDLLNELRIDGVKIHSLFVMRDTQLAQWYENGNFVPISLQTYIEWALDCITRLSPDIVIHRLTGNCLRDYLVAPDWIIQRDLILYTIDRRMIAEDLTQGCRYQPISNECST